MDNQQVNKSINLRVLFTVNKSSLPNWIHEENTIYQIYNLVNGKSYIGQARWLYGRFVANTWMTHKHALAECNKEHYTGSILYNALLKYKSRNFEVRVLESSVIDLNAREEYWIRYYHTCIYDPNCNGYNMNYGGSDVTQLLREDVRERSLATKMRLYGNPIGPDAIAHSLHSRELIGNGNPAYMMNTKESIKKRQLTCSIRYGNICGQMHTKEVVEVASHNMRLTKLFQQLEKRTLISNSLEEYLSTYSSSQKSKLFIERLRSTIDDLIKDPRWTPKMTVIFKDFIKHD